MVAKITNKEQLAGVLRVKCRLVGERSLAWICSIIAPIICPFRRCNKVVLQKEKSMQAEKPAWILIPSNLPRYSLLPPILRGRFSVVAGEQFQIQNIDHAVIVQVCLGWGGGVVTHANRQCVELVDHVVAVNIAG